MGQSIQEWTKLISWKTNLKKIEGYGSRPCHFKLKDMVADHVN